MLRWFGLSTASFRVSFTWGGSSGRADISVRAPETTAVVPNGSHYRDSQLCSLVPMQAPKLRGSSLTVSKDSKVAALKKIVTAPSKIVAASQIRRCPKNRRREKSSLQNMVVLTQTAPAIYRTCSIIRSPRINALPPSSGAKLLRRVFISKTRPPPLTWPRALTTSRARDIDGLDLHAHTSQPS